MAGPYVDPIPLPKPFCCADDKRILFVDDPADIVGNSSGGIGDVRAPFEDDDLKVRTAAFGLAGGAHPRGIASYNNEPFGSHNFFSLPAEIVMGRGKVG